MELNWLDIMCRVGYSVTAVLGASAATAAVGAATGAAVGPYGAGAGAVTGAIAGTITGVTGAVATAGDVCDEAAYNMYMRQKCAALVKGDMPVEINNFKLGTVKELAAKDMMPLYYYNDLRECDRGGYLPTNSKGMVLP